MKTETYLNAMVKADHESLWMRKPYRAIRQRQYRAFRARILRMDADKDVIIQSMWKANDRLAKQIAEKDAEIVRLEKFIEDHTHTLVNGWVIKGGNK